MKVANEIAVRGVTALYPAELCLSQWLIDQGIREVNGAIVMDLLAIGIKTAELKVELERRGIKRYSAGAWATPSAEVRALLAREFDS